MGMVAKQQTVTKRRSAKAAAVDGFAEKIGDYSDDFLLCRDMGHGWEPWTVTRVSGGSFQRVLRCSRCSTSREQTLDKFGYLISNRYGYTTGYVIPGTGRLTAAHRATLRLTSISTIQPRSGS